MIYLRSFLFRAFLILWTAVAAIIQFPLLFFPGRIAAIAGYIWASGILLMLRWLCGVSYQVTGKEHLPAMPFIIAAKHQSAWDTIVFLKELDAPVYVLKKELLYLPLYGLYLKSMGMIAIDRLTGGKALRHLGKLARHRLNIQKRPVVIFPEGTRSMPGQKKKYLPGITYLYNDPSINAPVIPVALNSGTYWNKKDFVIKPGVISLCYLSSIEKDLHKKQFIAILEQNIENTVAKLP